MSICPTCKGSGFSSQGSGYDSVCSECGGMKYLPDDRDREFLYAVGDYVKKRSGYEFPGIVVATFRNRAGNARYVVEATHFQFTGMLHIFNQDQLIRQRRKETTG